MLTLLIGFLTLSIPATLSISLRQAQLLLRNPLASSYPMSPLDPPSSSEADLPESPPPHDDALTSFRRRKLVKRIINKVGELPPCQRQCLNSLYNKIGSALPTKSYADKYHKACSTYRHARKCAKKQQKLCNENGEMFTMATSAFKANLECIERNAFIVQGWLINPMVGMGGASQQEMRDSRRDFDEIIDNACIQTQCSLRCMQGKYDMVCEHSTGMLLSEAIVRPLAVSQRMFPQEYRALGMMLPNFFQGRSRRHFSSNEEPHVHFSGTRMIRHRIDPYTNAELLKRFGTTDEEENNEDEDFVEEDPNNKSPIYGNVDLKALGPFFYSYNNKMSSENNHRKHL